MFKETKRIAFTTKSGFHLVELDQAHAIWDKVWFSLHHRVGKTEHLLQENIHGQCSVELYPSILLPLPLSNSTAVCSTKYLTDWKTIFESIIDVTIHQSNLNMTNQFNRVVCEIPEGRIKKGLSSDVQNGKPDLGGGTWQDNIFAEQGFNGISSFFSTSQLFERICLPIFHS